ncbi:AMP-dependent synthetase and ligase [Acinetobacter baumannii]|uniref:AMP-binding protein n=1 Tax=Acinetobacter baumannii TaxID=470 RepID=UPI000DE62D23|nr:AMP-binding protein [Acinetobacter baumannii]MBJ9579004.1 AMP-binding protein [Acinetobacter baumannii]SSS46253.1 AMP-dependent synthetase and ligase [Acinetobacter baumannii]
MYSNNHLIAKLRNSSINRDSKVFIQINDTNEKISYGKFFENSEKIAQILIQAGIQAGDRVLNYAPKTVTSLELYVGTVLAGAIYVPINSAYSEGDLAYFIDNAEPKIIVCQEASLIAVQKCLNDSKINNQVKTFTLNTDESGSLNETKYNTIINEFSSIERGPEDIAAILYTSGTTGRPKGVVHTHRSLATNAETLVSYWHFSEKDVLVHALPLFHLHGLFTATNVVLFSASSMIYLQGFDVNKIMNVLPNATVLMGVPPFYMALLTKQNLKQATNNMRLFLSGSAPMLPQTHLEWYEATGHTILERYGMTEGSMIASNPYNGERRPNSVGFPLPNVDVRITSPACGKIATKGEIGFVEMKGENLFSGYWRLPEKTAEDIKSDGYFVTGDYGKFDEDGYLHIIGRVKDAVVISETQIIFPKEIEAIIDSVDGVKESAVIAVPNNNTYQLPVAIVAYSPDVELNSLETNIKTMLQNKLTTEKIPAKIVFVEQLPRNIMGKVQKVVMRETYKNLFNLVA